MTDDEKAGRLAAVEQMPIEECEERLNQLNGKAQNDLTDIEKAEYLILKWKVEGKESFFNDSYIASLLQELILLWIEEERDIPEDFATLFVMTHVDWLIDWDNSSEHQVVVRHDIVDNMHTFINPFLEEIEEILGETFKSRNRNNIKDRIVTDIEGLLNFNRKTKLPSIYNALFKVKYALQGAREYMQSNNKKSIKVNSIDYHLDIQSIAHIFVRHTNRFKTLSHTDNRGKRGFLKNELGDENEELDKLLKAIEATTSTTLEGVITCQIESDNYKIVIKTGRIVTLYPLD